MPGEAPKTQRQEICGRRSRDSVPWTPHQCKRNLSRTVEGGSSTDLHCTHFGLSGQVLPRHRELLPSVDPQLCEDPGTLERSHAQRRPFRVV